MILDDNPELLQAIHWSKSKVAKNLFNPYPDEDAFDTLQRRTDRLRDTMSMPP
jgi:hypothetical protein